MNVALSCIVNVAILYYHNHNLTPNTFATSTARLEDASEGVYGDDVTPSKMAAEDRKLCSTQLEFDSFALGKHRLRFTIVLYIKVHLQR